MNKNKSRSSAADSGTLLETIFNSTDVLIEYLDTSFTIIRVNRAFARADKKSVSHYRGKNHFDLYPDENNRKIFRKVVRTGKPHCVYSDRFVYPDNPERGTTYWDWCLQPVKENGKVTGLVLSLKDVTGIRQVTEKLRESEKKYATLVEHSRDGVVLIQDHRFRFVNKGMCRISGYSGRELNGMAVRELIPAELRKKIAGYYTDRLQGQQVPEFYEAELLHKSGRRVPVIASAEKIMYNGAPAVMGYLRDITEQKAAEAEIREERDRAQTYLNLAEVMFVALDTRGRITMINAKGCRLLGRTEKELLNRSWFARCIPARMRGQVRSVALQFFRGETEPMEYFENPVITAGGEERLIAWHNTVLCSADGTITGLLGSGIDITDRRKGELALRESELQYRELVEHAGSIILRVSAGGDVVFINEFAQRFFGYPQKDICGKNVVGTVFPRKDENGKSLAWLPRAIGRNPERYSNYEGITRTRDGRRVWVAWAFKPIAGAKGGTHEIMCIGNDITLAKKAQDAQLQAALLWQSTFDAMNEAICFIGLDGTVMKANRAVAGLLQMPMDEVIGARCHRLFHHSRGLVDGCLLKKVRAGAKRAGTVMELEGRWLQMTADPVNDDKGAMVGVVHIMSDITEQKTAIDAMEASERKYRQLFANMTSGFALHRIITDWKGRPVDYEFLEINDAFEQLTGIMRSRALGRRVSEVLPGIDRDPANWISKYGTVALTGKENSFESFFEPLKKWLSIHAYSPGRGLFATVLEDVTVRKNNERLLQESEARLRSLAAHLQTVREEERTVIAREIHDELGQLLTAFKMDVSWLERHVPKGWSNIDQKLEGMKELVDRVIGSVKRISADLRPALLDDLGLYAAMEWQAAAFTRHMGIPCRFRKRVASDIRDGSFGTALFRIFQEALTNVARHAQAHTVTAAVTEKDGVLTLAVRDDGIGLSDRRRNASDAYGLIGMRERALSIGGTLSIRNRKNGGTEVKVVVPVGNDE